MAKNIKTVALWGGWSRNYGDLCINASMKKMFKDNSSVPLEFIDVNSDLTYDPEGWRGYPAPTLSAELVEEINDTSDMLVVGGGGQLMKREAHQSPSRWQFSISQEDLEKLRVPLIVYGIGYNKFPKEQTFIYDVKKHLRATYKKSSLFSVRNVGTANVVRETLSYEDPIYLIADPAMFVESKPLNIPKLGDKPVLGLNWAGDAKFKRFSGDEEHYLFMDTMDFCKKWVKDTGGKVLYIPHVMYYDFDKFKDFKDHLGDSIVGLHQECPWLYPEHLLAVPLFAGAYKACTAVIAMRGHGNIVPFGLGVPAFGFGAQDKVAYFQDEVGGLTLGNNPTEYYNRFRDMVFTNRVDTLNNMGDKRKSLFEQATCFTRMCLGEMNGD